MWKVGGHRESHQSIIAWPRAGPVGRQGPRSIYPTIGTRTARTARLRIEVAHNPDGRLRAPDMGRHGRESRDAASAGQVAWAVPENPPVIGQQGRRPGRARRSWGRGAVTSRDPG